MLAESAPQPFRVEERRDLLWRAPVRLIRHNPIGAFGAAIMLIFILMALFADVLAPFDPTEHLTSRLAAPNGTYFLGADEFGRDVLSRVIYGSRISLSVGIVAVLVGVSIGSTLGILAGYFGGKLDNLIMRIMDILFAFPTIVLVIVITGMLGPSLQNAMLAIAIVSLPSYTRVARAPVLKVIQEQYVEAARAVGADHRRIILRHVLPNVLAPIVVQMTVGLPGAILTEASLSFLGLGTQPPDPSWGTMLGAGRTFMVVAPWVAVFPGLAIMTTVLGFNLLGDGLRDLLDPQLRRA